MADHAPNGTVERVTKIKSYYEYANLRMMKNRFWIPVNCILNHPLCPIKVLRMHLANHRLQQDAADGQACNGWSRTQWIVKEATDGQGSNGFYLFKNHGNLSDMGPYGSV